MSDLDDVRREWAEAAQRAVRARITVHQLARSGQWIATSTKRGVAYELDVTDNVAHGCACDAGKHGLAHCLHRAAFYLHIGALTAPRECVWCNGSGLIPNDDEQRLDPCSMCDGTGRRTAENPYVKELCR